MNNLVLLTAAKGLAPLTTAVLWETDAAKYVKLGIHEFRDLVDGGIIVYRLRPGHKHRIYLKSDLDAYLANLPIGGRIAPEEDLPSHIRKVA